MKESEAQQSVSNIERANDLSRSTLARWLAFLSLSLFIMGPIIITVVVVVAKADGQLPSYDQWRPGQSNHGLWHGVNSNPGAGHLRYGFDRALMFPFFAFLAGIVSCIVRPNWIAKAVLILSILFDLSILIIFFPLLD